MKKRALIIEDEHNIANAEALILSNKFEVHHAFDGNDGIKKARELRPHLIILDLMIPKRNGYEVCFHLRQDKSLKGTKILMVTAKNQELDEQKGMFIGADDYIMKPFSPEELLHVIEQVMKAN